MEWDQKRIEELVQFIVKYELTEVEVQSGDSRITLKKNPAAIPMTQGNNNVTGFKTGSSNTDFRRITEKKAQQDELETEKTALKSETVIKPTTNNEASDTYKYVTSSVAGIFYRQSQPGHPPYVEVGQKVKKGDIVCLVEAMKMINEICATSDGVVKKFLVENEQFVEYGSPLVLIEEE